jgi:hypothetical protein
LLVAEVVLDTAAAAAVANRQGGERAHSKTNSLTAQAAAAAIAGAAAAMVVAPSAVAAPLDEATAETDVAGQRKQRCNPKLLLRVFGSDFHAQCY